MTESNYKKFSLKAGDVLIARTGNTIGVNIFIDSDLRSVFNNGLICIKANTQKIQSKFLYYLFKTRFFEWHIKSIAYGTSTQPNMQSESLLRFSFNLPPLDVQNEILKTLSCLDAKIENLRRQNETLEKIAQTLFKHWFIDFEFPNVDGKPYKSSGGEMVPSELGDIPEGWRVGTLGDYIYVKHGYAFKGEYITTEETEQILLTPGNFKIGGGFNDSKYKFYSDEYYPDEYILKKKDLTITMTELSKEGDTLGYPAFIPEVKEKVFLHNQRIGKIENADSSLKCIT